MPPLAKHLPLNRPTVCKLLDNRADFTNLMYGRDQPVTHLPESDMIPSRKPGGGGGRTPRRVGKKGKPGLGPIIGVIVVLVVIAVSMVLIIGSRSKPETTTTRSRRGSTEESENGGSSRRRAGRSTRTRVSRREQKAARRDARRAERQRAKAERRRTRTPRAETRTRAARGSRGETRAARSGATVDAIIEDKAGSRFALVGSRPLRAGDVFDGRRIVSVEAERVQVEHAGRTWSVRIGQSLY